MSLSTSSLIKQTTAPVPKFGFEGKKFENVEIMEFVDGDTMKCILNLGKGSIFGERVWVSVRLVGIDAPELKGETICEKICATFSLLTLANECTKRNCSLLLSEYSKEIFSSGKQETAEENSFKDKESEILKLNKTTKDKINEKLMILRASEEEAPLFFTLETFGSDLYGRVLGKLYYSDVTKTTTINDILCEKGVARPYKGNKAREKWSLEELYDFLSKLKKS